MRRIRRPLVAVAATAVLLAIQAAIDPSGLLALVGWPGGVPQAALGWPLARYLVFAPVMLAVVWWAAVRAGERFWTMTAGVALAALLAQALSCLAMTGDVLLSGWAAGYIAAKAVPSALIVAAVTWLAGGRREPRVHERGTVLPAAIALGVVAPLVAGSWWQGVAYPASLPSPRVESGLLAVVAVLLLAGCAFLALRWMRRRVPGLLGVWLGAMVAGGMFGLLQGLIGLVVDDGFRGDMWPLLATYVHVADGLSYGASLGWLAGIVALVADRVVRRRAAADAAPAAVLAQGTAGVALLVAAALAAPLVAAPPASAAPEAASVPAGFLRVEGGHLGDGEGHQVLLRGVNVNQLVDFFQPRPGVPATRPLSEDDFAGMAAYGFTVARLNISWSALEPVRGRLDPGYLDRIRQAVAWAKRHGIRTVLDMHQDGWWNAPTPEGTACRPGTDPMWGYDGAPAWATITDGAPRCEFTGRDISPAGDRAFEHFWFDTDGVQSALVRTWGELAGVFRDEPAVAGFDLLNEPGFGETAPVTTSKKLAEFSARAIAAIRGAGAPQIVFVEPSILWSGLGIDSGPARGFTDDANVVFSPHLYAESITMDRSLGLPTIVGIERQFGLAQRLADGYGMPLWSGEYGYWGEDADIVARLGRYAAEEDARMLGSAYWVWKQACGDPQNGIGELGIGLVPEDCATGEDAPRKAALLGILSRAYPRQAPGVLTELAAGTAGDDGATFRLAGTADARACGLEVWIPGAAKPAIGESTGLDRIELAEVDGGWLLTACAEGDYALASAGYPTR